MGRHYLLVTRLLSLSWELWEDLCSLETNEVESQASPNYAGSLANDDLAPEKLWRITGLSNHDYSTGATSEEATTGLSDYWGHNKEKSECYDFLSSWGLSTSGEESADQEPSVTDHAIEEEFTSATETPLTTNKDIWSGTWCSGSIQEFMGTVVQVVYLHSLVLPLNWTLTLILVSLFWRVILWLEVNGLTWVTLVMFKHFVACI